MIDKAKVMKSIKSSITRFDKAAQAYSNAGSQHPEDAIEIEIDYKNARRKLEELISGYFDLVLVDDSPKTEIEDAPVIDYSQTAKVGDKKEWP